MSGWPAYLHLARTGELARRAQRFLDGLVRCTLCPRRCGVDRGGSAGDGVCRTGRLARVASAFAHHGEEDCLRGRHGSGTIFFVGCNLGCVFCQNWDISHGDEGRECDARALAGLMLRLQGAGCHNVNLVTPTHVVAQVLEALVIAARAGLRVPLVWNSGGYDGLEILEALDGVVDIYMPDVKTLDAAFATRAFAAPDYPDVVRASVAAMHRQVGDLACDAAGLARRGLLVRHLVMPGRLDDTADVCRFLARDVSRDTFVNVMGQYRPEGEAMAHPDLARRPRPDEIDAARRIARAAGLHRLD